MMKLGGSRKNFEGYNSLMASGKYGIYFPNQTWVFGVFERQTGRCYIEVVSDRSRKLWKKILKNKVEDSTVIITDQTAGYNKLYIIGFKHLSVCHNTNFVDPETCAHTQTIKSPLNHFKKKKHVEYGIERQHLRVYC
ncbi:hypothetical protein DMUE_3780 [Dictyocoela muelleri]|nr:hypothetical protein DMUE_3780 [Dictyocoela muelleri]